MPDDTTTMSELKQAVKDFIAERDWEQFHSPKNIAMSIAIEAAELMEHFQWLTTDQAREVTEDPATLAEIRRELADVAGYVMDMATVLDIDLSTAILDKLEESAEKYPIEECKGSARKYTELRNAARKSK